jgi:serine/threonine protein kinase
MSLAAGTRIGPYEILGSIGAGGMGEVYRAHDAKLNRDVALKVLPEAFVTDPDRLARFRHEARVLAVLNHPNIGQIYGFEDSGGSHALVLELVEGVTLEELIEAGGDLATIERPSHRAMEIRHDAKSKRAGGLSLDQIIPIARQIAEALEAAHEQGLVHRDLKPANVKVREDGTVKVLDFGLAKALDTAAPSTVEAMNARTLTAQRNELGLVLGTAAYMAPEQARGRAVDKRADIWAFGAVLYEMVTGQRAFKGEEVSDVLAAVLRQDVDWTALPTSTPASIRRLLARSLERDVQLRLRDIGEARVVLADPATLATTAPISTPQASGAWRLLPWAVAALFVVAAGVGWWGRFHPPPTPPRAVTRSAMILSSSAETANDVALSHDGTRLAYWEGGVGHGHIVLRLMDQMDGKAIPGTDDGDWPVFSPDGQWIAFFSGASPRKLKKISVTGGMPITLCDAGSMDSTVPSISWDQDETVVFGSDTGLMRVAAAGGRPEPLTTIDAKAAETGHTFAQLLPGGQSLLFTITGTSAASSRIAVLDLRTHLHRVLVNGAATGRYVPTGHLVYQRGDALLAVPFDIKQLGVTGSETPVVEGVSRSDYTFSNTGLLVFTPAGVQGSSTLEWMDRKGAAQPLPAPPRAWGALAVSPNGKLVAATIRDNVISADTHTDIWKYDIERTTLTKMTFEGSNDVPVWSRDGEWVTYRSTRDGKSAIYRMSVSGNGPPDLVIAEPGFTIFPSSWASDGTLVYSKREQTSTAKMQIWILPAAGSRSKPQRLLQTAFDEWNPGVSQDGRSIAYMSEESGQPEIYVVPFPGPGGKVQISTHGGVNPRWSRNGRELFYTEVNAPGAIMGQLMAVNMQTATPGRPQPLFKVPGQFDVTPDPQQFLVARRQGNAKGLANRFIVITDWFEDLRRRAPIKR